MTFYSHQCIVSYLFSLVLVYFFFLPRFSKKIYFSENALQTGAARATYSQSDVTFALRYQRQTGPLRDLTSFRDKLTSLGLEYISLPRHNESIISVLHAPRSTGKECVVFTVPYPADPSARLPIFSFLYSLIHRFVEESPRWLHLDIVFLFVPKEREHEAVKEFLESLGKQQVFGIMRESLVLDFTAQFPYFDYVGVSSIGKNGELPNLDMVNIWHATCSRNQLPSLLFADPTHRLQGESVSAWEYKNLIRFWWKSALGFMTGIHGHFRSHGVFSMTVTTQKYEPDKRSSGGYQKSWLQLGSVIEGWFRCMNNLHEELHHSYFLYFKMSTYRFIGFEDYSHYIWAILTPMILMAMVGYTRVSSKSLKEWFVSSFVMCVAGMVYLCLPGIIVAYSGEYWPFAVLVTIGIVSVCCILFIRLLRAENLEPNWDRYTFLTQCIAFSALPAANVWNSSATIAIAFYLWLFHRIVQRVSKRKALVAILLLCPFSVVLLIMRYVEGPFVWTVSTDTLYDLYSNVLYIGLCMICFPVWLIQLCKCF